MGRLVPGKRRSVAWLPLASAYRLTPQPEPREEYVAEAKVRPVVELLP
ncbi:hypothetical protein OG216_15525 [Streptomycetaceae bacterium NBC_01309]